MAVEWEISDVKTNAGANSGTLTVKLPKSGPLPAQAFNIPFDKMTQEEVEKSRVLKQIITAINDWRAQLTEELEKVAPPSPR